MKRILFIPILLVILCSTSAYSTKDQCYKQYVKSNVKKAISFQEKDIRQQWTSNNINKLTTVLITIENHFGINHKKMLSTILTESDMDIYAVSGPNRNGSYDYGLVQQNSPYLKRRYNLAKKILNKYNIAYSNDVFDISVNVMSGAVVLKDFKSRLKQKGVQGEFCHFVAYNCGPSGYFYPSLKKVRYRYLKRYKRFYYKLQVI